MQLQFDAKSINEGFARVSVAAFLAELNPTLDEISDIKTAVSEAVTNAIIHGYGGDETQTEQQVRLICMTRGMEIEIIVEDDGVGIFDIEKAKEPFFTTKPELERSGMGFAFMEAFMDELEIFSTVGNGTKVIMRKLIGRIEG